MAFTHGLQKRPNASIRSGLRGDNGDLRPFFQKCRRTDPFDMLSTFPVGRLPLQALLFVPNAWRPTDENQR